MEEKIDNIIWEPISDNNPSLIFDENGIPTTLKKAINKIFIEIFGEVKEEEK